MPNQNQQKGFTLIETLAYIAIIGVFIGATMVMTNALLGSSNKIDTRTSLLEDVRFVEQKFKWAVRGADQINIPSVGSSGTTLSVDKTGFSSNPIVLDFDNETIYMKIGNGEFIPITSDRTKISDLNFTTYNYADETHKTVRLQAVFESTNITQPASFLLDSFVNTY
ncbi:MAG: type II secretion system protein [Parcubacteria group bacterium]